MANYICSSRTNYFRVTDEVRYKELFDQLYGECDIYDFTTDPDENGVIWHGFGSYSAPCFGDPEEADGDSFEDFLVELQKVLPDDEAFIYQEAGNEKLRYVIGCYIVCTNKAIIYGDTTRAAIDAAKKLLGGGFRTQMEY